MKANADILFLDILQQRLGSFSASSRSRASTPYAHHLPLRLPQTFILRQQLLVLLLLTLQMIRQCLLLRSLVKVCVFQVCYLLLEVVVLFLQVF